MAQDREEDFKDRDEELLRAARAAPEGDLRAFEQLVQMHQKRILADCRYLTGGDNDSEDLAQEVFVKAFFGLRGFEGRSTFRHWLQRIKVHHCLNHLKRQEGKAAVGIDEEAAGNFEQLRTEPAAERNLELAEERERISGILNSMPATLRVPLVMRDMDELSYEEIAASLGVGLSAVKMRIKRAREHFRNRYEGDKPAGGES
jgi:RNA polymerase sigma-70 factor, ECF subfamily